MPSSDVVIAYGFTALMPHLLLVRAVQWLLQKDLRLLLYHNILLSIHGLERALQRLNCCYSHVNIDWLNADFWYKQAACYNGISRADAEHGQKDLSTF